MLTRRAFIATVSAAALLAACSPQVADHRAESSSRAAPIRVSGSGAVLPAVQKLGEAYRAKAPGASLQYPGGTNSGGGIRGVVEGTLDVAAVNRPLSDAEAREAIVYVPFVRDAAAFAVHRSVSVKGLRTAQIRDIYSGKTTNWREVGGPDAPVIVLDRDEDDSLRKLAMLPLMAGAPIVPSATVLTSASDMLAAIDSTPGAIGYSSLGLLRLRAPKQAEVLALDEVLPSGQGVASGTYAWALTFALVLRSDAPPTTRAFVEQAVASARGVLGPFDYAPV